MIDSQDGRVTNTLVIPLVTQKPGSVAMHMDMDSMAQIYRVSSGG